MHLIRKNKKYETNLMKLKGETVKSTIIIGVLNTLSQLLIERIYKNSTNIQDVKNIISHCDLIGINTNLQKTTFLTGANRTFTEIKHVPTYMINLSRLQKTEILKSMFSDHEEFNQKIIKNKISRNFSNIWKLSNTFLNKHNWKKSQRYFQLNNNKRKTYQNL